MRFFSIAALFLGVLLPSCTHAAEKTKYQFTGRGVVYEKVLEHLADREEMKILLEDTSRPFLGLYETDLNGDQVNEILVFPGDEYLSCEPNGLCYYFLYVRSDDELQHIGTFKAFDIHISDDTTNGVRDLFVFENTLNQFRYNTYKYNKTTEEYELQEE